MELGHSRRGIRDFSNQSCNLAQVVESLEHAPILGFCDFAWLSHMTWQLSNQQWEQDLQEMETHGIK